MRDLITLAQATVLLANQLNCRVGVATEHLEVSGIRTYRAGRRRVVDRADVLTVAARIAGGGA